MIKFKLKDKVLAYNEVLNKWENGIITDFYIDDLTLKYTVEVENNEVLTLKEEKIKSI